jgi:subtilisin family serine protease
MMSAARTLLLSLIAGLLVSACADVSLRDAPPSLGAEAEFGRQILVTITQDSGTPTALLGAPGQQYRYRRGYGPTPSVERALNRLERQYGVGRVRGWPIRSLGMYCEVYEVPDGVAIDAVLESLSRDPDVAIAQRMNTFAPLASGYDDPLLALQFSAQALGIEAAHRVATGRGITIAIIDSMVDRRHPDLDRQISLQRDFSDRRSWFVEAETHGTAIAGIIASLANNTEGIVGVAPGAEVAALRACWSESSADRRERCTSFSLALALEAALDIAPDVINLSLVGPRDRILERLIDNALQAGIIVVAARDPARSDGFPASHKGVLTAESPSQEAIAKLSNHHFRAPSVEVLSTTPGGGYGFFSGPSLAAAHLSGVIALILEANPGLDLEQLSDVLRLSAGGSQESGSINACKALAQNSPSLQCESALASVAP